MSQQHFDIVDVIPHAPPMSLLDSIESWSATGLVARVNIRADSLFCEEQGVPCWVGIEYMGQAVAAWAGVQERLAGRPVKVGFLVSSRKYVAPQPYFAVGSELRVEVEQVTDNAVGLSVFDCRIINGEDEIRANLNVFVPDDVSEFLAE